MKERLDVLLVKQGLAPSREKARAVIMSGNVFVNGEREDKAGSVFDPEASVITVTEKPLKYVSRGGLKLEKAMQSFPISLEGKVCMDIGSSTGGFTDCMLQSGAAKVYAVDVGHGQLAWKLRCDERVVCMEKTNFRYMVRADIQDDLDFASVDVSEKTNFRYMVRADIQDDLDFASVDVSFISLTKILVPARKLLKPQGPKPRGPEPRGQMVCLIKPQFEAGREKVGKKGVVREPAVHREVIEKVIDFAHIAGFSVQGLTFSPVRGPEGNIEYLIFLQKEELSPEQEEALDEKSANLELETVLEEKTGLSRTQEWQERVRETVEEAHNRLD